MTARTSAGALLTAVAVLAALTQCGGGSDRNAAVPPDVAASTTRVAPDPIGLVALGHSGLTGTHSDPNAPDTRLRENSWATGTCDGTDEFAQSLTNAPAAVQQFSGTGPGDLFDPDGTANAVHIAALTEIVEGYEAEQVRVCARVPQCHDDGGALAAFQDDVNDLGDDLNHLNVRGLAQEAATVWPTVVQVLGLDQTS